MRLRHTLSHQRGECQQRIRAVLYHHGCTQRRNLMTEERRRCLTVRALPMGARDQAAVELRMTDALDAQMAPLNRELRAYARRQIGCKAR